MNPRRRRRNRQRRADRAHALVLYTLDAWARGFVWVRRFAPARLAAKRMVVVESPEWRDT